MMFCLGLKDTLQEVCLKILLQEINTRFLCPGHHTSKEVLR